MTLKTKKWFYFNLIFVSGGLGGFLIGYMIKNGFSIGMAFTVTALLMTALASYIQWKYIVKTLTSQK